MANSVRASLAWLAVAITLALLAIAGVVTWQAIQGPGVPAAAVAGGQVSRPALRSSPTVAAEVLDSADHEALDAVLKRRAR